MRRPSFTPTLYLTCRLRLCLPSFTQIRLEKGTTNMGPKV